MDSRIEVGAKLDLEKIENRLSAKDEEKQVYISQVLDEAENGNILVSMPVKEGNVVPLGTGQKFIATFYTKSGLLRCNVVVTGRFKKGALFLMELAVATDFKKVQRREFFRYSCRMPMEYRLVKEEEKALIDEGKDYEIADMQPEWKNAAILDISGGGLRFVSTNQEPNNALIQVRFSLKIGEEDMMLSPFAILLRCEQNSNNKALYNGHIMFKGIDKKLQETIVRFIFEEQRKKRSKDNRR